MEKLNLKPTHKPVQNYYEALRQFRGGKEETHRRLSVKCDNVSITEGR